MHAPGWVSTSGRVPGPVGLGFLLAPATLGFAYLVATAGSLEFRIYLLWAIAVAAVAIAFVIRYDVTRRTLWLVLGAGLIVKLFGSAVRYEVIYRAYDGVADATGYYSKGLRIARGLWHLDLSGLFTTPGTTAGTRFVTKVSGVIVSLSGPSMRAAFLLFALLAFAGVLLFASAYSRVPGSKPVAYLGWLVFWPSIVFWPSSIGKEAFLLFTLGLAVWGYARFPSPAAWPALVGGLLLTGMVRPHLAGVAAVAMAVGVLTTKSKGHVTGRWYFQLLFWGVALAITVYLSAGALGIESAESAVEKIEYQATQSNQGGSAAGVIGVSPLRIPHAFVRALFRPFIWEVDSPFMLVSALEVIAMVALIALRRRQLWAALRDWRQHRLIGFSLVFVVLCALMLGFAMSNLAIIARQRALLFPMLLLLLQRRGIEAAGERRGL